MGVIAKAGLFEIIRAVRQGGAVAYFLLAVIAALLFYLMSGETRAASSSAGAERAGEPAVASDHAVQTAYRGPWSRILGNAHFEKITDVAVTPEGELVFAGLTLGMGQGEASEAVLIRASSHGRVHSQVRVRDPQLGSVSGGILDTHGRARLIHWQGVHPAFAMLDAGGNAIWSRTFPVSGDGVWAETAPATGGETLVAIAEGYETEDVRIVRLDAAGKILWRHALELPAGPDTLRIADSGDGGAVLAYDLEGEAQRRRVEIARLDRRGRQVWSQSLTTDTNGQALADLLASPEGIVVLIGGAGGGLYSFDRLGELVWVREAPLLAPDGHHVLARSAGSGIHVLAETRAAEGDRRHWLAEFDPTGRPVWSVVRANRMNATYEAVELATDGTLIAGGSLIASTAGDTDMVMVSIGPGGSFPSGYGQAMELKPGDNDGLLAAVEDEAAPEATLPILAASVVVEGSLGIEDGYHARPAPALHASPAPDDVVLASVARPDSRSGDMPVAEQAVAQPAASLRAISAPVELASEMALAAGASSAASGDTAVSASAVEQMAAPPPAQRDSIDVAVSSAAASSATRDANAGSRGSSVYAYQCTFTCLADSEDIVKYPVSRIIKDVSEPNAALVSLDVLAMDHGVCAATGGRIYDQPRLPPSCTRLN